MPCDYDLVIIGATFSGVYAALEALKFKSRIALVQQPFKGHFQGDGAILGMTYNEVNCLYRQLGNFNPRSEEKPLWSWQQSWGQALNKALAPIHYLPFLSSNGIDIIEGSGEFARLPQLSFIVGRRKITSSSFLIATGSRAFVPAIVGLDGMSYLTADDIYQKQTIDYLPESIALVGGGAIAFQLAETLNRFGHKITLIAETEKFLPAEDEEISRLFLAVLEADGIEAIVGNPITQIGLINSKKCLQAGSQVLECDEIIFASRHRRNMEGLNLTGVGVRHNQWGIKLNNYLQTTNPAIYACGSLIEGLPDINLAIYEARRVVNNLLSPSTTPINYRAIPYISNTLPAMARIGLTETQARHYYGDRIQVLKTPFKSIIKSHFFDKTTGFCKLIADADGEIIGGHFIGEGAEELIAVVTLAMQEKIKIKRLKKMMYPFTALSEIIGQTVALGK